MLDPQTLPGNVETVVGVAQVQTGLAGGLSLGSAVVAEEWVQAHDDLGRNRP